MPLSDDDVREILRLIDETDVEELRVETEAFSLYVRRGDAAHTVAEGAAAVDAQVDSAAAADVLTISAPMLGTFYRAESPGASPFVAVGTRVEPDTVVCLIEVMKMMNPVPAGVVGTIVEVCADNAELVEYGAPLFQVEPG
jgi:acetyl-CoA carboxylase biotin carboxyl carrier protein